MTTTATLPLAHRTIAAGPPKLGPDALLAAQQQTLDTPRLKYSLLATMMSKSVDLLYRKQGSLTKFVVLEIIAHVPYQAWERMGYWAVHRHAARSTLARRVFDRIVEASATRTTSSGTS
jgi:ubiquinol oxidase